MDFGLRIINLADIAIKTVITGGLCFKAKIDFGSGNKEKLLVQLNIHKIFKEDA
jgi:hypothetical protein